MKTTISKYGWLVVTVIIIAILIGLALPAANYMKDKGAGVVGGLGDKLQSGQDYTMPYTVSLKTNIAEAGTVTFTGEHSGTKINLQGQQTVSVRATANGGYAFVGWYVGDTLLSTDAEYSLTVNAATKIEGRFEVNCVDFTVTSANRGKVGYTGEEGENLVIPEKFEDTDGTWYRVVAIGDSAFYGCTSLTSVTIPDSVTVIGKAFNGCTNLKTVYYEGTIEQWCNITFSASGGTPCVNIAALYIDGELADDIVIPDTVTEIKEHAFYGCTSLTSITIPDSVTSIGRGAFSNCTNLASVTIPDSVTTIGNAAFQDCINLKTVYYEGTIEQWCNITFESHTGNPCNKGAVLYIDGELADDIIIPDTITEIKRGAFYGCTGLTSVTISDGVTSIGKKAFQNCTSLESITISDGVTTISEYAFYDCTNLTSITIPDSVTSIGERAFERCTNLKTVYYEGPLEQWCNITFSTYGNPCVNFAALYIAGELADDIMIPDTVTEIKNYAFYGCTSLTSVTISDGVTSIGKGAFSNCTNLASVTIPDGVTTIGDSTFERCSNLRNIRILATEPPTLGTKVFNFCPSSLPITVPAGCADAYKAASGWSSYASQIVEAQ